ncbi:MAG: superoxide dismutase family protein, partial [Terriglobales bacterium]
MKTARLLSLALLVIALTSASSAKMLVQLKDAQGKVVGSAILWESGSGIAMELNFENLPAGEHAIHFHQNAKCEAPDFKTAGGHF